MAMEMARAKAKVTELAESQQLVKRHGQEAGAGKSSRQ